MATHWVSMLESLDPPWQQSLYLGKAARHHDAERNSGVDDLDRGSYQVVSLTAGDRLEASGPARQLPHVTTTVAPKKLSPFALELSQLVTLECVTGNTEGATRSSARIEKSAEHPSRPAIRR